MAGILKNNRGFTIIELVVVIAILLVLAVIIITNLTGVSFSESLFG